MEALYELIGGLGALTGDLIGVKASKTYFYLQFTNISKTLRY